MHRQGGFTLAELLVGLVVTSIVMVAVTAAVIGVQQSYQADTENRILTENGRSAVDFLERTVSLAGFGVDPRIAFDVTPNVTGAIVRDNFEVGGFTPAGAVLTDDLAYRFRDPGFLRTGTFSGGNVAVTQPFGVNLPAGTLLMVVCRNPQPDNTFPTAYVRVSSPVTPALTTVAAQVAGAPFAAMNSTDPCLAGGGGTPWVFLMHENRVRVVNIDGRPWLVRYRSLERAGGPFPVEPAGAVIASGDDTSDFEPLAPDVENFQVAFGMNRHPTNPPVDGTGKNWVIGDSAASAPDDVLALTQPTNPLDASQPGYLDDYTAAVRYTAVPANIRTVHVSMTVRTARRSPTPRRDQANNPPNLFNSEPVPAPGEPDGFARSVFHTVIPVTNMNSRTGFIPAPANVVGAEANRGRLVGSETVWGG